MMCTHDTSPQLWLLCCNRYPLDGNPRSYAIKHLQFLTICYGIQINITWRLYDRGALGKFEQQYQHSTGNTPGEHKGFVARSFVYNVIRKLYETRRDRDLSGTVLRHIPLAQASFSS